MMVVVIVIVVMMVVVTVIVVMMVVGSAMIDLKGLILCWTWPQTHTRSLKS